MADASAAVANDMHIAWSLPGVWYMTHLQGPGVNVTGVAIPGVPAIVVGRNEHIAWGITNLGFDVQDLYVPATQQARLEREGRTAMAQACFDFLPTRAELDLLGWEEPNDLFHH